MSNVVTKDSAIAAPTSGADATGRTGVFREAGSTTAWSRACPSAFKGNFVRFQAVGVDVYLNISKGAAGVTVVLNQLGAIGTGHAAIGFTIPSGSFLDVIVPKDATFINLLCSANSGYVEVYLSEALVV